MKVPAEELTQLMHYQIAALEGMAKCQGQTVDYVKPHGALYNDMMANEAILHTVMSSVASYPSQLKLMIMSTQHHQRHRELASSFGVSLLFEAFADRRYNDSGLLVARSEPNSILNEEEIVAQVRSMVATQTVSTASGGQLTIPIDSICVHGDNLNAIGQIKLIHSLVTQ
jgi:UPF0271 protein